MHLFFDTETTGIPRNHKAPVTDLRNWPRLVQLAWLLTDTNGNEITSAEYVVKPEGFVIPNDAAKIHGITTDKAQRIEEYVTELRSFARREASGCREVVDMREVVDAAVSLTDNLIHKSTRNFSIDDPASLPLVRGHPQRLSQVVVNLIQNACHALTDRGQAITVAMRHDTDEKIVELIVRDEGCGMDQETMARILEPFYTTRQATGGTGLGLSVSKRIVDEHGGRLEFDSDPGKGTTALLILPVGK